MQRIDTLIRQLKTDETIARTLGLEVAIHPACEDPSGLGNRRGDIYILNSGNRRLHCLREAGVKSVLCNIVPYDQINPRAFTSPNGGIKVEVRKEARTAWKAQDRSLYDKLIKEQIRRSDLDVNLLNDNKLAKLYEDIGKGSLSQ